MYAGLMMLAADVADFRGVTKYRTAYTARTALK